MDVDRHLLDGDIVQTALPRGHDAVLGFLHLGQNSVFAAFIEPNAVGQVRAAEFLQAFAVFAVTGRTVFDERFFTGAFALETARDIVGDGLQCIGLQHIAEQQAYR